MPTGAFWGRSDLTASPELLVSPPRQRGHAADLSRPRDRTEEGRIDTGDLSREGVRGEQCPRLPDAARSRSGIGLASSWQPTTLRPPGLVAFSTRLWPG